MQTYYSPSEEKFYEATGKLNDWVLANVPYSDTKWTTVSEYQEDDGNGGTYTAYAFAIDEGTKASDLAQEAAYQAALNDYAALNTAITNDAASVAGTTNQISSLVDIFTYQRMSLRPELFDQEGIACKKDIGTFTKGQLLTNDLEVKQYADLMLADIDAFLIRRMKAITNYILGV